MAASLLRITGQVQGVCYRAWAAEKARSLGVSGWVRNRLDGSVELLAAGTPDQLSELVALCRVGPPAAHVDHVAVEAAKEPVSGAFRVLSTA